ncbi:MAG: ZIP family metal transporter [Pseudomonadota bacterium]
MHPFWWIIGSVTLISIVSLVGATTLLLTASRMKLVLYVLVGFSAGAMMGGAFLHLLPEALTQLSSLKVFITMLFGFSLFFLLERLILWHHCHDEICKVHPFTYLNLLGDGIHNFIDGFIIATAYLINIEVGLVTTLAIILHEIPQELGDFGVLVYGGFRPRRALFMNFMTAVAAVIGAIIGYLLHNLVGSYLAYVLPFAAGNFIYIAGSDLIPELHKEPQLSKSVLAFSMFIAGLLLMAILKLNLDGAH